MRHVIAIAAAAIVLVGCSGSAVGPSASAAVAQPATLEVLIRTGGTAYMADLSQSNLTNNGVTPLPELSSKATSVAADYTTDPQILDLSNLHLYDVHSLSDVKYTQLNALADVCNASLPDCRGVQPPTVNARSQQDTVHLFMGLIPHIIQVDEHTFIYIDTAITMRGLSGSEVPQTRLDLQAMDNQGNQLGLATTIATAPPQGEVWLVGAFPVSQQPYRFAVAYQLSTQDGSPKTSIVEYDRSLQVVRTATVPSVNTLDEANGMLYGVDLNGDTFEGWEFSLQNWTRRQLFVEHASASPTPNEMVDAVAVSPRWIYWTEALDPKGGGASQVVVHIVDRASGKPQQTIRLTDTSTSSGVRAGLQRTVTVVGDDLYLALTASKEDGTENSWIEHVRPDGKVNASATMNSLTDGARRATIDALWAVPDATSIAAVPAPPTTSQVPAGPTTSLTGDHYRLKYPTGWTVQPRAGSAMLFSYDPSKVAGSGNFLPGMTKIDLGSMSLRQYEYQSPEQMLAAYLVGLPGGGGGCGAVTSSRIVLIAGQRAARVDREYCHDVAVFQRWVGGTHHGLR